MLNIVIVFDSDMFSFLVRPLNLRIWAHSSRYICRQRRLLKWSSSSSLLRLFTTSTQNIKPIQSVLSDIPVTKACEMLNSRKLTYSEVGNIEWIITIG